MTIQIKQLKANQTELHLDNGTIVFFSYDTPVAACLGDGSGFVRTTQKYSVTTSKHIKQWLGGARAQAVAQEQLDAMID